MTNSLKPVRYNHLVLGFAGPIGAGKSTAAAAARQACRASKMLPFAGPFKEALLAMGFTEAQVFGREERDRPIVELGGVTMRRIMQTLGTEWGRELIHPDLWVWLWRRAAQSWLRNGVAVLVDDVRFPNEIAAIRQLGGKVAWLALWGGVGHPGGNHVSERSIDPKDCDWAFDPLKHVGGVEALRRFAIERVEELQAGLAELQEAERARRG